MVRPKKMHMEKKGVSLHEAPATAETKDSQIYTASSVSMERLFPMFRTHDA